MYLGNVVPLLSDRFSFDFGYGPSVDTSLSHYLRPMVVGEEIGDVEVVYGYGVCQLQYVHALVALLLV